MKSTLLLAFFLYSFLGISQSQLKVGDNIEARWKQGATWYKGKIGEIKDTLFFINYNDGDTEWTTADFIRLEGEVKVDWPENTCSNKASLYKVDEQVDVEENGVWYDAKVLKVKDGQYYIHYDNYSSNFDCVVNNDRIRKWTGKKVSSVPTNGTSSSSSSGSKESSEITLTNVCRHDVTMYIGDKEYNLAANRSVDVQISESKTIYAVQNGRKMLIGTAQVNGAIWNFNSRCD